MSSSSLQLTQQCYLFFSDGPENIRVEGPQHIASGQNLKLTCSVHSVPDPIITWLLQATSQKVGMRRRIGNISSHISTPFISHWRVNPDKTEVMLLGPKHLRELHLDGTPNGLIILNNSLATITTAKRLGVLFDQDLSLHHI